MKTVSPAKLFTFAAFALLFILPTPVTASGITVYQSGDKHVEIGGRIQLQYHWADPDREDAELMSSTDAAGQADEVFLRRLRPYIKGSLHRDWEGKLQWEMGMAEDDDEMGLRDAYLQYGGLQRVKILLGNVTFPFSRELLTSSKKQQLVERTFVGDHNYGTPEWNAGVHLVGDLKGRTFTWRFSIASASLDPDAARLDFDTPVNREGDFNEGWITGGRLDWHPLGYVDYAQGDFTPGFVGVTLSVAAFVWDNDDDNNTYTDLNGFSTETDKVDVDEVIGMEVSGAFRGHGFSVDAEFNLFDVEAVDGTFSGGLYEDGQTELWNAAVEGGYMILPEKLEMVAGYQMQDADGYEETWTRTSIGANYFIKEHDIKVQGTYRMGSNLDGVDGNDADELFVQTQYVF